MPENTRHTRLLSTETLFYLTTAIKMVWHSSPGWTIINLFFSTIRGCMPVVVLVVVKLLVDEVTRSLLLPAGERNLDEIVRVVVIAGCVFLINAIASSIGTLTREKQSHKLNNYIQSLIHDKTTRIHYSFFENPDYQNTYYRAINDANFRPTRIFYGLVGLFQSLLTVILIGGVMLSLKWWVALIVLGVLIPMVWHRILFSRKMFQLHRQHTEDERRMGYYNRLLTVKEFAKEQRIFQWGDVFKTRFLTLRGRLHDEQFALMRQKATTELITQVLLTLVIVMFYGFIAMQTLKGEIGAGYMVMLFLAMQRGYGYFQELLSRLTSLYEDSLFLRNFIDFLQIEVQEKQYGQCAFPVRMEQGIVFKDVSFRYPHSRGWVLQNINLTILPGETIALVGANGAGKSTFVKLLSGLYEPLEGRILIDGIGLDQINRETLSQNVSVIFQDFMLYNVSARENIWLGNIFEDENAPQIKVAASNSGVHDLLDGLPDGYDTVLGNLFKGSEELSQGEWQRIALARSFFNKGQLIILDEPTSSLDAFTEARLISHFKEIVSDRTAVIVSHRLSTINLADKIAVLEDTRLVEFGTPAELLAKQGAYYRMVQQLNQAKPLTER